MTLPLFIREIGRDLAARKTLSAYLVKEGCPPAGTLESLASLRARYRDALVARSRREAAERGEPWEDES